jgi:hypothetical protein
MNEGLLKYVCRLFVGSTMMWMPVPAGRVIFLRKRCTRPFALSLSKGIPRKNKGFDRLSPNGWNLCRVSIMVFWGLASGGMAGEPGGIK